jgi:thymidine kinase
MFRKMPKLYFRYGAMNSSKSANLLMVAHNYRSQGRDIVVMKPAIDDRDGKGIVSSRAGLSCDVDILVRPDISLLSLLSGKLNKISCILVDEVQFLTKENIDELRILADECPVICYGLRTDYKSHLFPGSQRLLELCDSIEEIKTICVSCSKKAVMNAKFIVKGGVREIIKGGSDEPDLGSEEKYQAMCWSCWSK